MSVSSCTACLDDLPQEQGLTCVKCKNFLCDNCAFAFIQMSLEAKTLPICADSACSYAITHSAFMKGTRVPALFPRFNELLVEREKRPTDEMLSKQDLKRKLFSVSEKVVADHEKVVVGLPRGMQMAFGILSNPHIGKLAKRVKRTVISDHNAVDHHFIECPSELCTGHISATNKCDVCSKRLCKKCLELEEESAPTCAGGGGVQHHICKPDVIETVRCIKESSRNCPKCHITISRSFGCDHMWCTNCHTSFCYSTGTVLRETSNPEMHVFKSTGVATSVKQHRTFPELPVEQIVKLGAVFDVGDAKLVNLPQLYTISYQTIDRFSKTATTPRLDTLREKLETGVINDSEFANRVSRSHELDLVDKFSVQVLFGLIERVSRFYHGKSDETAVGILSNYIRTAILVNSTYVAKIRLPTTSA